jgi:lysophospholipase L1-like esterase
MEWELEPNFDGLWTDVHVQINSMGFRDSEIPISKKPNEFRILFLGDSVVFGYNLPQRDTIPEQLEYSLNQEFPQKFLEVVNAGVDGYSTFQEFYLLKYKGLRLKPDLVIVGFVLNDVYEHYRTTAQYGGAGGYVNAGRKSLRRTITRLLNKSAFYTSLHFTHLKMQAARRERLQTLGKWRYRSRESIYNISEIFKEEYSPEIELAWADTLEQLVRLQALATENGVRLLLVLFPYAYQLDPNGQALKPQSILIPFCRKQRIAFYDLLPSFLEHPDPESLFLDGNHFNADGCEFIARTLCDRLSRREILFQRGQRFVDSFDLDATLDKYKTKAAPVEDDVSPKTEPDDETKPE